MADLLPIFDIREELLKAFARPAARVIVEAPTGSGKSTQIPQFLLDHDLHQDRQIVILQPRRLAARVLAQRVASERGVNVGDEVGYDVRFERASGPRTRIRFITEGVLMREMLADPHLNRASIILFDEFHERHLHGDLSLALVRRLQETTRPDLKLGVMSATLQTAVLREFLPESHVITSTGRQFPVDISYLEQAPRGELWDTAADTWHDEVRRGLTGNVLIFMPGGYEIDRTIEALRASRLSSGWDILPLHADLPPDRQDAALRSGGPPKVIVSTNVAETSLTIDGIRMVIDSGLARMARFDPRRGFDALTIEKISRAAADQRAGRAGRTAPGRCWRLWTLADHATRAIAEIPEIQRVDLAETVLTLHGLDHDDPASFPWVEPPLPESLHRAESLLTDLGALQDGRITAMGRDMLTFPVHPRFARMLIEACARNCSAPVAAIAALCQGKPLLIPRADKQTETRRDDILGDRDSSDFFRELRALEFARKQQFNLAACRRLGIHAASARQAARLAERFHDMAKRKSPTPSSPDSSNPADESAVRRCILAGFADQVARRRDGGTLRCDLVHRRRGEIERDTVVRDAIFLVAAEITEVEKSSGDLDVRLRRVTAIEPEWLAELFPGECQNRLETTFDETTRRVTAHRVTIFRDLIIERGKPVEPDPDEAARLLARRVLTGTCPLKNWNDEVEQYIHRLNCLAQWAPEWALPPLDDEARLHLIEQICFGATGYKDIKDKEVMPVLRSWLSHEQQLLLDRLAPERWKMPDNRRLKIRYQSGSDPVLSAKIQNLYDMKHHPCLVDGKIPVVLEILGPNMRPLQVTRDLPSFWSNTYPQLRPELARRYPKHEWR